MNLLLVQGLVSCRYWKRWSCKSNSSNIDFDVNQRICIDCRKNFEAIDDLILRRKAIANVEDGDPEPPEITLPVFNQLGNLNLFFPPLYSIYL